MDNLPACPCKLPTAVVSCVVWQYRIGAQWPEQVTIREERFVNPDPDKWNDPYNPNSFATYHSGAKLCIRSRPIADTEAGEQCCYDPDGKLITTGLGAGSADRYAPEGVGGVLRHRSEDVLPWIWAQELDGEGNFGKYAMMYYEVRKANNKNNCPENKKP